MRLEVPESLPCLLVLRVVPGPAALGKTQAVEHSLAGEPGQLQELVAVYDVEDGVCGQVGHGEAGHGLAGVLMEQQQRVHGLGHAEALQGQVHFALVDLDVAEGLWPFRTQLVTTLQITSAKWASPE